MILAYAGLSWRLAQGPIALTYFDTQIVGTVQADFPEGVRIEASGTVLERDASSGRIQVSLVDFAARDPFGAVMVRAPRATFDLSGFGLATGRIVPTGFWLLEPRMDLVETEDGLQFPDGEFLVVDPLDALAVVVAAIVDVEDLDQFGLRDGTVSVRRDNGASEAVGEISLTAVREGEAVTLTGHIGSGEGAPRLHAWLDREADGDHLVNLRVAQLAAADLGPVLPQWVSTAFSGPVSGELALRLHKNGDLDAVGGDIRFGAGHVGGGQLDLLVDEADISFSWSRGSGRITIEPSSVLAGYNQATLSGEILIPERGDFNYGTIPLRVAVSDVTFGAPAGGRPAVYPSITLEALYVPQQNLLHVSRLDVAAAEAAMSFVGIIGGNEREMPGIQLAGTMLPVSYDALPDLWPPFLGSEVREWIIDHLSAGQITDARLSVDIPPAEMAAALRGVPLPESAYLLEFGLEDLAFRYLGDMPPISDAQGRATLTPNTFDLTLSPGSTVRLESGEEASVGTARFLVDDVFARAPVGQVSLDLSGSVSAMLELFDHHPLELASSRDLDPKNFSGEASLDIGLDIPLIRVVQLSDVGLSIEGRVDDFAAKDFQGAQSVTDGHIDIQVVDGRVQVNGQGLFDGVPTRIAVDEALDGSEAGREQSVTMQLDDTARERLGIALGDILTGPVTASISELEAAGTSTAQRIEADLTDARISFPQLAIDKPQGAPASASFRLAQDTDTVLLSDLSVDSGALRLSGAARFTRAGELLELDLPVVRTASGTELSVSAWTEGNGQVFELRGAAIDLRPILRRAGALGNAEEDPATGPDLADNARIEIDIESALGFNGQRLTAVSGQIDQSTGEIARFALSGRTGGNAPVTVHYATGSGGELTINTEDAGRFLAWTGLYPNMRAGRLSLAARQADHGQPFAGRLVINGFAIADDPSLSRLIASGERETRRQYDAASRVEDHRRVNPSNVGFDTLSVPFSRAESRITIQDGVLRGPAIGATLEGQIDTAASRMALNGTFVPLYEINNLFGQLPLFGPLLGGRRNEGLLGITYSVSGSLDDPVLTLNPLSFVAPGVFRYILGMDNPRAATSPRANRRDPAMR